MPDGICTAGLAARLACADCQQLGYILDDFPHTATQVQTSPACQLPLVVAASLLVEAYTNVPQTSTSFQTELTHDAAIVQEYALTSASLPAK